jgi:dolichyl-diphosphooligosaccharide--protein glycosyltransferase
VYVAYTTFWAVGGPLAMLIRFIGSNHVTSHELLAFNGLWLALQAWEALLWMRSRWGGLF